MARASRAVPVLVMIGAAAALEFIAASLTGSWFRLETVVVGALAGFWIGVPLAAYTGMSAAPGVAAPAVAVAASVLLPRLGGSGVQAVVYDMVSAAPFALATAAAILLAAPERE